nr:hypothetical protein [Candidatus Eremiobacteraeota bacterium]
MRTRSPSPSALRSLSRSLLATGAVIAGAAVLTTPATAQGRSGRDGGGYGGGYGNGDGDHGRSADGARTLYAWSGRVDREAMIVMQNGGVRTRLDGYDNGAGGQVRVASALPQVDGVLDVRLQ